MTSDWLIWTENLKNWKCTKMTPKWPLTVNNHLVYTNCHCGPDLVLFCSMSCHFRAMTHFINTSLTTMLNVKRAKKLMLQFHNSVNTFGRYPSQEYSWILESESYVYLQRRWYVVWNFYTHMVPCGRKLQKENTFKIQNFYIYRALNNCGRVCRSMHDFGGVNLMCILSVDVVWIFSSHMARC